MPGFARARASADPWASAVRERIATASVQAALAKGHRLGFIGSTDTHSGRPGTGPARCALLSGDLSRASLWDALHSRSCYATTGAHVLVFFTVNDKPMGSEMKLDGATPARRIHWRVVGTGPLKRVDLLCSNAVVRSWAGGDQGRIAPAAVLRTVPVSLLAGSHQRRAGDCRAALILRVGPS